MQTDIYRSRPCKRIRQVVERLGPAYDIRRIDLEWVGYRKLSPHYDLEISQLDRPGYRRFEATVYLWQTSPWICIRETYPVRSFEELQETLQKIERRFTA